MPCPMRTVERCREKQGEGANITYDARFQAYKLNEGEKRNHESRTRKEKRTAAVQ